MGMRKTCETCGQEDVSHNISGGPHWAHTRTERHQLARAREQKRNARRVLISGLRAAIDRGHLGTYAHDMEQRCAAYFGADWIEPGTGLERFAADASEHIRPAPKEAKR